MLRNPYRVLATGFERAAYGPDGLAGVLDELGRRSPHLALHLRISLADTARDMAAADLVVVTSPPSCPRAVPPALFEALAEGRPIMSLCHNPEVPEILWRTGGGLHFGPDDEDWAAHFLGLAIEAHLDGHPGPFPRARRIRSRTACA